MTSIRSLLVDARISQGRLRELAEAEADAFAAEHPGLPFDQDLPDEQARRLRDVLLRLDDLEPAQKRALADEIAARTGQAVPPAWSPHQTRVIAARALERMEQQRHDAGRPTNPIRSVRGHLWADGQWWNERSFALSGQRSDDGFILGLDEFMATLSAVRGHWKPRLSARVGRPVWVQPYWKGSEGAPQLVRDHTLGPSEQE